MSLVRLALLALTSLLLTSCYTQDINLQVEVDRSSAVYSSDSLAIYFVANASAWKRGKNIWFIMPIEGQRKFLHNNLWLYYYQIQEQRATPLFDLGTLSYSLGKWSILMIPFEHGVFMTLRPLGEQDVDRGFIIDNTGKLSDAVPDFPDDNLWKVNYTYLDSIVRTYPYATFGLYLKEIDPASEREYIRTLTSLENTDSYHRLVIEQVVSQKDKKTIRKIYRKMQKSLDNLSGYERSKMEWQTQKSFELMEKLLEE